VRGPDGKLYIISEEINVEAENILSDISPLGKAKATSRISAKDFKERTYNLSRIRESYAYSLYVEESLLRTMSTYENIKQSDREAIVRSFMLDQSPEQSVQKALKDLDLTHESIYLELTRDLETGVRADVKNLLDDITKLNLKNMRVVPIGEEIKTILNSKYEMVEARYTQANIEDAQNALQKERQERKQQAKAERDQKPGVVNQFVNRVLDTKESIDDVLSSKDHLYIDSNLNYRGGKIEAIKRNFFFFLWGVGGKDLGIKNEGGKTVLNSLERINRIRKSSVTVGIGEPPVQYFMNNLFGPLFQAYNMGGLSLLSDMLVTAAQHPGIYFDVIGQLFGKSTEAKFNGVMITRNGRFYTSQMIADEIAKNGVGSAFIHSELANELAVDIRKYHTNKFLSLDTLGIDGTIQTAFAEMANLSDNFYRVATFMDLLKKGESPENAAKFTRDTYFDYASLTEFEKRYMRQVFLFYSFMRRNQVQIFRLLRDDPQKVLNTLKFVMNSQRIALQDDDRDYLSEYDKRRLMFRGEVRWNTIAEEIAFSNRVGSKIYIAPAISTIDGFEILAPMANLSLGMLYENNYGLAQAVKETVDMFAVQTAPGLKVGIEYLKGKQLFGDREFDKIRISKTEVDQINSTLTVMGFNPLFKKEKDIYPAYINLKLAENAYISDLRKQEEMYEFQTTGDLAAYMMFLEMVTTVPGVRVAGNTLVGRAAKSNKHAHDMLKAKALGTKLQLPPGTTIDDMLLTTFSMRMKYSPNDAESKNMLLLFRYLDLNEKYKKEVGDIKK